MISGRQIREGRKLASMTVHRLARDAKLDTTTICRAEAADGEPPITMAQAAKIEGVLIRAGVEFIDDGQPGVRLRQRGRGRAEIRILEEATRMFEADHPGMRFEGSSRPTVAGQDTEIIADPAQRADYIAKAERTIAERDG